MAACALPLIGSEQSVAADATAAEEVYWRQRADAARAAETPSWDGLQLRGRWQHQEEVDEWRGGLRISVPDWWAEAEQRRLAGLAGKAVGAERQWQQARLAWRGAELTAALTHADGQVERLQRRLALIDEHLQTLRQAKAPRADSTRWQRRRQEIDDERFRWQSEATILRQAIDEAPVPALAWDPVWDQLDADALLRLAQERHAGLARLRLAEGQSASRQRLTARRRLPHLDFVEVGVGGGSADEEDDELLVQVGIDLPFGPDNDHQEARAAHQAAQLDRLRQLAALRRQLLTAATAVHLWRGRLDALRQAAAESTTAPAIGPRAADRLDAALAALDDEARIAEAEDRLAGARLQALRWLSWDLPLE